MLRQLVLTQLTRKIAELPVLLCAADQGEATFADCAAALDALACRYAATNLKRHPGERLSAAVDRSGRPRGPRFPGRAPPMLADPGSALSSNER